MKGVFGACHCQAGKARKRLMQETDRQTDRQTDRGRELKTIIISYLGRHLSMSLFVTFGIIPDSVEEMLACM